MRSNMVGAEMEVTDGPRQAKKCRVQYPVVRQVLYWSRHCKDVQGLKFEQATGSDI